MFNVVLFVIALMVCLAVLIHYSISILSDFDRFLRKHNK